jgi:hypothetical protein
VDCCEHDNDISGSVMAVYSLKPSESQLFGSMYNFYAVFFFCNVFGRDVGEDWRRSVGPIV